MTTRIRPASLADQTALLGLYRQLNPTDPSWPSDAIAADVLSKVIRHAGTTILIFDVDGIAVSTCMLIVCPNFSRSGRPFALIENVVTDREYRQRGFGRQVVEQAIEIARREGCYRVTLMTGSRKEETLRFYEAAGMRRNTKTTFEARFI